MAIIDSLLEFSTFQVFTYATASGCSFTSTNVIDLGPNSFEPATHDATYPGWYGVKELVLNVETGPVAITAPNPSGLYVRVYGAATAASAAGGGAGKTPILQTGPVPNTQFLKPGAKLLQIAIPRTVHRFLSLNYYFSSGPINMSMNAWIGLDGESGHQR